jgi:energy-converting hydrogenase Eha subunit A
MWCLIGCSIGDFGTILFFQYSSFSLPTLAIMTLAIINGIITSIILETIILSKQMKLREAFDTAVGMSLISMLMMEISMNALDWIVMGGAKLNLTIIPLMLFVGFITPLPYNYWRLKKYGKDCH